ncbi:hypothetical protein MRX96_030392 [Rhipicephalus microplus]
MPAGVGRRRKSRSRDLDADDGRTLSKSPRHSGPDALKAAAVRPQLSATKVRFDAAGRPRGRTSSSEHEEAPAKHPGRKPVGDDMDTDSDSFLIGGCFEWSYAVMRFHGHCLPRGADG